MQKIRLFLLLVVIVFFVSGCDSKPKLYLLNWGEYINDEVVKNFENEYNVKVILSLAESNELFYSKLKSNTMKYDLVVPSEYMVDKMVQENLLQKIDFTKLNNYDPVDNPYMPGVIGIQNEMFEDFKDYTVPYFWGTFGLMYNKRVNGLENAIITHGWKAYFEEDFLYGLLNRSIKVGMYDVPRFAYSAALLYNNMDPNLDTNDALTIAEQTLLKRNYAEWGTDTLKKNIMENNLDLAFVYTGDLLDVLYTKLETETNINNIMFDIYIPDNTIAFLDSFVIPKNARNVDLAHQFIDYLLNPENAYLNASVVGYCTPLKKSYDMIVDYEGDDIWLTNWAYANKKYYPLPDENDPVQYKGVPLANLNREFLNKINTMVNNVKAK